MTGRAPRIRITGQSSISLGEWISFSEYWSFQDIVPERERLFVERWLDGSSEPEVVAIDIGANVGAFTLLVASLGSTVHAFEPIPETFCRLKKNLQFNGLIGNAHLNCLAVGEGSGLVVRLLDPQPGEAVLDVCSAPGGKTAAIAEHLAGRGTVVSADRSAARLIRVPQNAARLRLTGIRCVAADGRQPPFARAFDRVLVDAPCTGTGILGRRPEIRWNRTPADPVCSPK